LSFGRDVIVELIESEKITFTIELIENHTDDVVESVNNNISTFGTISKFSRYVILLKWCKRNLLFFPL